MTTTTTTYIADGTQLFHLELCDLIHRTIHKHFTTLQHGTDEPAESRSSFRLNLGVRRGQKKCEMGWWWWGREGGGLQRIGKRG